LIGEKGEGKKLPPRFFEGGKKEIPPGAHRRFPRGQEKKKRKKKGKGGVPANLSLPCLWEKEKKLASNYHRHKQKGRGKKGGRKRNYGQVKTSRKEGEKKRGGALALGGERELANLFQKQHLHREKKGGGK